MIPNPDLPFNKWDTDVLLAACLWGEARGSTLLGKVAVANVILNRMKQKGRGAADIILAPKQFSSFNQNDPNSSQLGYPLQHDSVEVWTQCYTIAHLALNDALKDNTGGASHYFADSMLVTPKWARPEFGWKETAKIGGHIFGIAA